MKRTIVLFCVAAVFFAGCTGEDGSSGRLVQFHGRKIDLAPYFEGFPYSGFTPSYAAGRMFYYQRGQTTELKSIALGGTVDLAAGEPISKIDFSKRNVWGIRYRKNDGNLYWSGDERNDEIINLYRLNPASKAVRKLTDVPYIFGWRWDGDQQKVAYVTRLGNKENRLGELRILDLDTLGETAILQDVPELRFTWGAPSWRPSGRGIVLPVLKNADRTYANLVYVDLQTKEWNLLTDAAVARSVQVHRDWLNDDEFLYSSNEDGYNNLYVYNLRAQQTRQLTHFQKDLDGGELLEIDGQKYAFGVLRTPIESELLLLDPRNGEMLHREKTETNVSVLDYTENRLIVSRTSASSMFRIDEITATADRFAFTTQVDLPDELRAQIMHAEVERVRFPTFDMDSQTGKTRMLHGYLYRPKNPLPKDQQLAMIQSFYGGGNSFSTRTQILCEAGIYVFSPSPRGSAGFGRTFQALNDKDLGGNEIIDIIYAGKYLSDKLGIPPERIGVYGGSHGGYATMRLLTFPGEVNGTKAQFDWGFGISHAGFSDIVHFYEHSNIPDWVTLEAGDPETEAAKLRDRSPLYHAAKLRGKLLMTHGMHDSRVPIEGSRMMADSLRTYGKDFKLVEFEGQGHGIKGLENNVRNYRVWFEFLESIK